MTRASVIAEALTMAYHRKYGLKTTIARIFNTYGPRMALNDGRVVPAFIDQALNGAKLSVFGDGSQTRSFCYVSDLVEGIVRLSESDERFPVNLGNPAEITILEFANRSGRDSATQPKSISNPCPPMTHAAPARYRQGPKRVLGWEPKVSLEEGLGNHHRVLPPKMNSSFPADARSEKMLLLRPRPSLSGAVVYAVL